LSELKYLLDVNVLIALSEMEHVHHQLAAKWFDSPGLDWGLCAFSEAGFLRVTANPRSGGHPIAESGDVLAALAVRPGYRYWPIAASWATLSAPFQERIHGHQQITDAFMLGLAVKEDGVLVTLDKAMRTLAGPQYSKHVLVLE